MSNINIEELREQLQQRLDAVRTKFLSELDLKKQELSMQISQKDEVIKGLENEREEQLAGYEKHRSLSRGPKLLDEKVYKVVNSVALSYIKQAREKRREIKSIEDEKSKLQEEINGLNEETLKDELIQRQETERANYILDLQEKQKETNKQIQAKKEEIKRQKDKYTENMRVHESYRAISGIKYLEDKTYKDASEKAASYFLLARVINRNIVILQEQLSRLEEDSNVLDTYLKELDIEEKQKSEISAQEDAMWAEYRMKDSNDLKQRKIQEKRAWRVHDTREKAKEKAIEKQTQEEIRQYNEEEDKKQQEQDKPQSKETKPAQAPKQPKAEETKPAQTPKQSKAEETKPEQPQKASNKGLDDIDFEPILKIFEQRDKSKKQQEESNKKNNNSEELTPEKFAEIQRIFNDQGKENQPIHQVNEKYTVNEVNFYLKNGEPVYEVAINTGGETTEYVKLIGWDNIKTIKPSESQRLLRQIDNPDKYYDQNIASVLEIVDKRYGTDGLAQYMKLLKTKPIKDESDVGINIDYDFSNLGKVEKENKGITKYIKKLASANSKLGRVSYEKSPNLFRRLLSKIKTLKLTDGKDQNKEKIESSRLHETTKNDIDEAFEDLSIYPSFSMTRFQEAYKLSDEQKKEYNDRLQQRLQQSKNNPKQSKRKSKEKDEQTL